MNFCGVWIIKDLKWPCLANCLILLLLLLLHYYYYDVITVNLLLFGFYLTLDRSDQSWMLFTFGFGLFLST